MTEHSTLCNRQLKKKLKQVGQTIITSTKHVQICFSFLSNHSGLCKQWRNALTSPSLDFLAGVVVIKENIHIHSRVKTVRQTQSTHPRIGLLKCSQLFSYNSLDMWCQTTPPSVGARWLLLHLVLNSFKDAAGFWYLAVGWRIWVHAGFEGVFIQA